MVITGGGEPGLVRPDLLQAVIAAGNSLFGKTVLITNGHHLSRQNPTALAATMAGYASAGLGVLAISRHHHDDDVSEGLMKLRTDVAAVARFWQAGRSGWPTVNLRLTCVLQRGGNRRHGRDRIPRRLGLLPRHPRRFALRELYVGHERGVRSHHRHAANEWSQRNQIPRVLVLEFAARHGFVETGRLPWGAPIFSGAWQGWPLRFAAYTEPSLWWERANGIARSWNLMSDGRCLASLEDRASEIPLPAAT